MNAEIARDNEIATDIDGTTIRFFVQTYKPHQTKFFLEQKGHSDGQIDSCVSLHVLSVSMQKSCCEQ